MPYNAKEIRHAYKSEYNLKRGNLVILLMITDGKRWHYLAAKSLPATLRGIRGNNIGEFYCLNIFRSYTTENKLEKHKNILENHDYCHTEIPEKYNETLKYNHGEKSMRVPLAIYADLECLLEKMSTCLNNPEKSSTTKVNKNTPSGYSLLRHCSFDTTKNKLDYYRGKSCMENVCLGLREQVTKIINYEKKEIPLKEEEKMHDKQKVRYICEKRFTKDNNNHCHYTGNYRGAAHKTPKEIPIVFHIVLHMINIL